MIDDADNLIVTQYVDFRVPDRRDPITTLIKACEKRFAPDTLGTIRISKPECFRFTSETLIADPEEMRTSQTTLHEKVNDPRDLAEARVRSVEQSRAAELVGAFVRPITTTRTKRTHKTTDTHTYGKNTWMFCTAIAPTDQYEQDAFQNSLPSDYDHVYYIHRMRAFALALGSMVSEQFGPRGREQTRENRIGELRYSSRHRSQIVIHGPVVYTEDPYKLVVSGQTSLEVAILPMFVKKLKHQAQREYRFVICSEEDPPEECLDVEVSSAMRGSMRKLPEPSPCTTTLRVESGDVNRSATVKEREAPHHRSDASDGLPSLFDLLSNPATPVAPYHPNSTDVPVDVYKVTTRSLQALHQAVEKVSDSRLVQVSSSAFHAEPVLRQLCEEFENPVRTIAISKDNFVVITINVPNDQGSKASIAIGPHGESSHHMQGEKKMTSGFFNVKENYLNPLGVGSIKELAQLGVLVRQRPA